MMRSPFFIVFDPTRVLPGGYADWVDEPFVGVTGVQSLHMKEHGTDGTEMRIALA